MTNAEAKQKLHNPNRFNGLDGALCFLLCLFVTVGISKVVSFVFRDFFIAILEFDTYAYLDVSVFVSQLLLLLVVLVYSKIRRVNPVLSGGYKLKWDGVQILMAILLTVGIMMLFYFTHLQLSSYAGQLSGSVNVIPENVSAFSGLFAIVYLLEVALFPAIIEESLFRGIIMKGFEEFGGLLAVVCSSVAFSLMHGSFDQMLLQFIGGLAIGAVVMITKNFLLGCIMHFVNNAFSTVYSLFITPLFVGKIAQNVYAVLGGATIILGVVFVLTSSIYFGSMLIEKEKNKVLGKSPTNKYEKKKYYGAIISGEEKRLDFNNPPKIQERNGDLYFIDGKYRKMNSKSPKILTFILMGIGLFFSIICIYFGL